MTALVFVYDTSNFQADRLCPVKQYQISPEPRLPFTSAPTAINSGASGDLPRGIYATLTDDEDVPGVSPTNPALSGIAFDLVQGKGKVPWPRLLSELQLQRVCKNFQIEEGGVDQFFDQVDLFLMARRA